ncbi:MAG: DegT/DnrJ/EryC1/StrS family aminotransferase [Rhodospirillaceae bacterium]
MSKVLVTGAGGFIGSHLVERLVAEGRHVRAFVEYDSRGSWGWLDDVDTDTRDAIEVIAGDIRDSHAVRQAMTGCDTVFHLAAHLDAIGEVHGETLINRETGAIIRALVPVHCYGHPANMSALADIAARFGLTVVEDAAESLGSGIGDTHTGRFGRVGAFSFNGNKTITTGGGGALITDDDLLARRLRHLTTTARANEEFDRIF